jgi:uncharacterized protein (TIGR02391 family)
VSIDLDLVHPEISALARDFIGTKRPGVAVFEATKALRNLLRERTGLRTDGIPLLESSFKKLVVGNEATRTGRNFHDGTAALARGIMLSMRNKGAHDVDTMEVTEAIESLATISLVFRRIEKATLRDTNQESAPDQEENR